MAERDFNHVKEWLQNKLAERKLSVNGFALKTGNHITAATIFRWFNDTFRPTPEKMLIVCKTLSDLPILEDGEPPRYEEVPLREAMARFTERPR